MKYVQFEVLPQCSPQKISALKLDDTPHMDDVICFFTVSFRSPG